MNIHILCVLFIRLEDLINIISKLLLISNLSNFIIIHPLLSTHSKEVSFCKNAFLTRTQ